MKDFTTKELHDRIDANQDANLTIMFYQMDLIDSAEIIAAR